MIPKDCKRLAEVDFPIAAVSKHAAREKSIRHGHPSTLHLWWARRPLASSRAVLMALLLPDPGDAHCPEGFKKAARAALLAMHGRPKGWADQIASDEGLRQVLLKFIADFANWDNAAVPRYLETGRALVRAAHPEEPPLVVDPFAGGGSIPLEALRLGCEAFATDLNPVALLILNVMLEDIPRHACLSADRGPSLADELRRVGGEIKAAAEKDLADLYPCLPAGRRPIPVPKPQNGRFYTYVLECNDGSLYKGQTDSVPRRIQEHEKGFVQWTAPRLPVKLVHIDTFGSRDEAVAREQYLKSGSGREWLENHLATPLATPIAYLWARTVRCESPNCGAEIPLLRSLWLCKKAKRKRALRAVVHHRGTEGTEKGKKRRSLCSLCLRGEFPHVDFEIFEPASDKEVAAGTVARAKASCLCCGTVLPPERVRAQLAAEKGGADTIFDEAGQRVGGARMTAVVTLRPGEQGRHYRLPTEADYAAVRRAQERVAILAEWEEGSREGLCPVPDEALPPIGTLGFRVQRYGMLEWGDLFTARQKAALVGLGRIIREWPSDDYDTSALLACGFSRVSMSDMSCTRWNAVAEKMQHTFGRQALPIVWDFAEVVVTADGPGNWKSGYKLVADVIESSRQAGSAQVQSADATDHPLPDQAASVWFTDPPYYDAIPYADLSDFFLVWLKRTLPGHPLLRDPFDPDNPLSPKKREAVQDETKRDNGRAKDRQWFEETMARAFAEGRRVLKEDGIGSVVFAHKTTEGWEALLSGLIRGGWTITGSWPIATEMASRLRARDSAALATSVHLICRPRPEDAPVGDWADVLRELPPRVAAWIERLQGEGIRGADLVFACIGPALEVFSRYRAVETAEGREVGLPEYLEKVWEVVGRAALEQVLGSAESGSLEEDARLVALFLWTLQSTEAAKENGKNGAADAADDDDDAIAKKAAKGFSLPFDVVRRFAQPMGIDLEVWTGRVIGQDKGIVRLLPVAERAKALFGEDGAGAAADWIESDPSANLQMVLFPEMDVAPRKKRRRGRKALISDDAEPQSPDATTLDRVHAAMLLQAGGQANTLRKLLVAEQDRGPDFLRLANALSALYPKGAEEKRLLDAMLLAVPR